jgi:FAD:protein FMN transferase
VPSTEQRPAAASGTVTRHCTAMASTVTVQLTAAGRGEEALAAAAARALGVFSTVEQACTRFDPTSPLMRLNAEPNRWLQVPRVCFDAVREAHRAYVCTDGVFDPRVFGDLLRLGYDRSLVDGEAGRRGPEALASRPALPVWQPDFRAATSSLRLGGLPVDLGGIGKGLAVRWAARTLRGEAQGFLVEAGGDCYCAGRPPDGQDWRVAVEDPRAQDQGEPLAVLAVRDLAVATSSVRVRRWRAGGAVVHHLVDPRDGRPGGGGLQAVTVVAADPADAEVATKVLFLSGPDRVAASAEALGLAALWVDAFGEVGTSAALGPFLLWRR